MATAKDGIEYLIEAKVNEAIKNLKKFDDKTRNSQKNTEGALNKMKLGYAAVASIIGGALVGSIINLGKKMVQASARFEQTKVSFDTFLGSAKQASILMAKLEKFSVITPFTVEQVNQAGKSLLAFGASAAEVEPLLKQIGDISAATGKDFNELTTIYGKAQVAGTLYAEDINQLIEAGVPILGEFANQLGVTEGEVKKLASEGKIGFGNLEQAFIDLTKEGSKFGGLMAAQSATLAGRISTLEGNVDRFMRLLGDELNPIVGGVVDAFNSFLGSSEKVKRTVQGLIIAVKLFGLTTRIAIAPLEFSLRVLINLLGSAGKALMAIASGDFKNAALAVKDAFLSIPKAITKQAKSGLEQIKGFKDSVIAFFSDIEEVEGELESSRKEKSKQAVKDTKEAAKKQLEIEKEAANLKKQLLQEVFNLASALNNSITAQRIENIEKETQALMDSIPERAELEALDNEERILRIQDLEAERDAAEAAGDQRAADDASRQLKRLSLEETLAKKESELRAKEEKEKKKVARQSAIVEKINSLAQVAFNTAVAITKAVGISPLTGGQPMAGIATGIGALQAGSILAQPLPAFAQGTGAGGMVTDGPQLFLAGENQTGKERIEVTPLNSSESSESVGNTFIFNGINDISEARNELQRQEGVDAWQ